MSFPPSILKSPRFKRTEVIIVDDISDLVAATSRRGQSGDWPYDPLVKLTQVLPIIIKNKRNSSHKNWPCGTFFIDFGFQLFCIFRAKAVGGLLNNWLQSTMQPTILHSRSVRVSDEHRAKNKQTVPAEGYRWFTFLFSTESLIIEYNRYNGWCPPLNHI